VVVARLGPAHRRAAGVTRSTNAPHGERMAALGSRRARDSELPPDLDENGVAGAPWQLVLALSFSYLLGCCGWHWVYMLPILWLLILADEQRRQRLWIRLHGAASAAVAASKPDESVTWLNQIFRTVWQMYEPSLARYALRKLQPKVTNNMPCGIGVTNVTIKSFSFGAVETRRRDGRHRLAPLILERVVMLGKSLEQPSSRDPRKERIRYVFRTDVRWHTGSVNLLVLEITHLLFPFDALDAEVSDLTLAGTLQVELDFVRPYPWLGHISLSFVEAPSIDFKLSLGASINVMELVPKLRSWLKWLLESTITEAMVGENKATIPLADWFAETPEPDRGTSRSMGKPGTAARPGSASVSSFDNAAACSSAGGGDPPCTGGLPALSKLASPHTTMHELRCATPPPPLSRSLPGCSRLDAHFTSDVAPSGSGCASPCVQGSSPRSAAGRREKPSDRGRSLGTPAVNLGYRFRGAELMPEEKIVGVGGGGVEGTACGNCVVAQAASSVCSCAGESIHAPMVLTGIDLARASPIETRDRSIDTAEILSHDDTAASLDAQARKGAIDDAFAGVSARAASCPVSNLGNRPRWLDDARVLRAVRAEEVTRGAIGELFVHITRVNGLVVEKPSRASSIAPTLAPSLYYICLAVGEGAEVKSRPFSTISIGPEGTAPQPHRTTTEEGDLVVDQYFRFCVHDSLTQRLRLCLCIKELATEVKELGATELSLASLRVNVSAVHAIQLPLAGGRQSAILNMQITFRLLSQAEVAVRAASM